jgi:hypothetical protein
MIGRTGACPKCNHIFVIPPPGQEPAKPRPAAQPILEEPIVLGGDLAISETGGLGQTTPSEQPIVLDDQPLELPDSLLGLNLPVAPIANPPYAPAGYAPASPQYLPSQATHTPLAASKPNFRRTSNASGLMVTTKVCGILLVVMSGMNALIYSVSFLLSLLQGPDDMETRFSQPGFSRSQSLDPQTMAAVAYIVGIVLVILGMGLMVAMAYGGVQMFRFKQWSAALAASIIAVLPCSCFTFFLSLPLGVLSIVMLSLREVRSAFD